MDPARLATTAQLTGALVSTYEDAVAAYVTWRRASITGTSYRRRALAAFCDTDPTVVGFCAVSSSLAAAAVQIRETYDAGFMVLGEQFARGNASSADALRDQLLTLTHAMSGLNTACSSARPGPLNLSHVIYTSESVRRSVTRTLSALYRRLALNWPQISTELIIPKARAPKLRGDLLHRRPPLHDDNDNDDNDDDGSSSVAQTSRTTHSSSSRHDHDRTHSRSSNSTSNHTHNRNHHHPPAVTRKPAPSKSNKSITSIPSVTSMRAQPPYPNRFAAMTPTSPIFQGTPTLQTISPRRKPVPASVPESRPEPKPESSHRHSHAASDSRSSLCFNSNPPSPPLTPEYDTLYQRSYQEQQSGSECEDDDQDGDDNEEQAQAQDDDHHHQHHQQHHHDHDHDHHHLDHAYQDDNHHYHHSDTEEMGRWAEMGVAVAVPVTVNNSVFSTFCPQAMALQVNGSSPMPRTAACTTCGHQWRANASSRPMMLKDGFRLTERFLAKSHCKPHANDALGGVQYGCVLCTSRGKTARYPTSAALAAHINEDHSKWQMLHDRDMI